jgi:WD40 repeat protein
MRASSRSDSRQRADGIFKLRTLALAVCPGGLSALSTGLDLTLRLWDLEAGACTQTWETSGPISSIDVDPRGAWALLGGVRGVIRWDLESWDLRSPSSYWTRKGRVTAVAYAAALGMVLGASEDLTIYRWELNTGRRLEPLLGHRQTPSALAVAAGGDLAASADTGGQLRLWDLQGGACIRVWQGHESGVTDLVLSPQGDLAVSAGRDRRVRVWDLPGGICARSLEGHTTWVTSVALGAGGQRVLSGGDDCLRLWDLKHPRRSRRLNDAPVAVLALAPDGTRVITMDRCDELRVRPLERCGQDRVGREG